MKKLFLSLLLLLGISSLASSSSEVSADVLPSPYEIPHRFVASREEFDVFSPSDDLVDHMMGQIADIDPRFQNLSQYRSLTYFLVANTSNLPSAGRNYQRQVIGYDFYIMPYFTTANMSGGFMRASVASTSSWVQYASYADAVASEASTSVKNALFASDFTVSRGSYVAGYAFDVDGALDRQFVYAADNISSGLSVIDVGLGQPAGSSFSSSTIRLLVRGNLINMPSYYRISDIDGDSLEGDGGSSGGDDSGFWNNFVFLFTGIFESLWNDIVGFFSPIVDFFVGIWNWFVDLFKFLFIPSEAFIENMMTSWNDWFKEEFGALYEAIDILFGVIKTGITDVVGGDRVIHLGTLFGGEAYIDYGVVERNLPSLFALLQLILRFLTSFTLLRSAARMFIAIASDAKIMF